MFGKQCWRCGMIQKLVLGVFVYVDVETLKDLDDRNSKAVVMEVDIRSGMCKNVLF